jgi:hypothetical protein
MKRVKQTRPRWWHFEPPLTFVGSLTSTVLATTPSTSRKCLLCRIKFFDNMQPPRHDQCMNFLTKTIPFGEIWEGGYNVRLLISSRFSELIDQMFGADCLVSLYSYADFIYPFSECSFVCVDKNMVKFRPEVHCPHIGPSGGDMCSKRTFYLDCISYTPSAFLSCTRLHQCCRRLSVLINTGGAKRKLLCK